MAGGVSNFLGVEGVWLRVVVAQMSDPRGLGRRVGGVLGGRVFGAVHCLPGSLDPTQGRQPCGLGDRQDASVPLCHSFPRFTIKSI